MIRGDRTLNRAQQWDVLLRIQDKKCGGCGEATSLRLDHDHKTGLTRGLLCNACNLMEGMDCP